MGGLGIHIVHLSSNDQDSHSGNLSSRRKEHKNAEYPKFKDRPRGSTCVYGKHRQIRSLVFVLISRRVCPVSMIKPQRRNVPRHRGLGGTSIGFSEVED